jgi:hypothetical protein
MSLKRAPLLITPRRYIFERCSVFTTISDIYFHCGHTSPDFKPEFEKKTDMARFPLVKAAETGSSAKNDYNEAVLKLASQKTS